MLVDNLLDLDFNFNEFSGKTDEELVLLARSRKDAVSALVSRYSKLILIKSEIIAYPDIDSDDLRQEGLMSLLKAIGSYDPQRGAKFSTFAEICIVNRMKTVAAKARDQHTLPDPIEDVPETAELSVEETPESIYLYKEFISELWKNIREQLSNTEMSALRLCAIEGMSYQKAAEMLGTSEKSIDNAMQRARKKLRFLMYD